MHTLGIHATRLMNEPLNDGSGRVAGPSFQLRASRRCRSIHPVFIHVLVRSLEAELAAVHGWRSGHSWRQSEPDPRNDLSRERFCPCCFVIPLELLFELIEVL